VYLGLAYVTRYTQGFYVYEWMNPAHGNASVVLHVLGYAGAMVAIFVIVRYAMVGRNRVARRMALVRDAGVETSMKLDNRSDTWSASVEVEKPQRTRRNRDWV
jgi:hypothetical protein